MASIRDRFRNAYRALRNGAPQNGTLQRWGGSQISRQGYGGLMGGGIVNPQTGMGGMSDKSEHAFFTPTRIYDRTPFEIIYAQSWAARKFIDIPIDDMLIRWREWQGDEGDAAVEAMKATEDRLMVKDRLRRVMKDGRLFGGALLCILSREDDLMEPLMPERIRQGDISVLRVFDRFSAYVNRRNYDVMSPDYGPEMYHVYPKAGKAFDIHASRVLRFDGLKPNNDDGYTVYDYDWGISVLIPAIISIMQDQTVATAMAHLSQVASIPVVSVSGLREALLGGGEGELSQEQVADQINKAMSVFRLLMLEKGTEEFTRVAVSFSGMDKLQEKIAHRLAAAADIPITRFFGQSPAGMNATGESDWVNYAAMVAAKREDMVGPVIAKLDMLLARDAGLSEPPEYQWRDLLELSESDVAEASKLKADALAVAIDKGMIDEDEGRAALDGDPLFGALPGPAPGMPDLSIPVPPGAPPNGSS